MLTTVRSPRRLAIALVSMLVLIAGTLLTQISPAHAEDCPTYDDNGNLDYENCGDGDPGDDGENEDDDGGGELGCEPPPQTTDPYGDFFWCEGDLWCQGTEAVTDPPEGETPPTPDSVWIFYTCLPADWSGPGDPDADQGHRWMEPGENQPPTLEERAVTAYGQLVAPDFELAFDPTDLTYVGMDTSFWADGPTDDTITGSEALGLVAETFNGRVQVRAGDGSAAMTCGWSVDKASAAANDCLKRYEESSASGSVHGPNGQPALPAEARLVFDVRFLLDGQQITVPGLDQQYLRWDTDWQQTPVPVAEIQVVVE